MKLAFLLLIAFLFSATSFAFEQTTHNCKQLLETSIKSGSTETALRAMGDKTINLVYQESSSRFAGAVVDGRGAEISLNFALRSSGEASLFAIPYTGTVGQILPLQFDDYSYQARFSASVRTARYTGVFVDRQGSKKQIYVNVVEKNVERSERKKPIWEQTGDAALVIHPAE